MDWGLLGLEDSLEVEGRYSQLMSHIKPVRRSAATRALSLFEPQITAEPA